MRLYRSTWKYFGPVLPMECPMCHAVDEFALHARFLTLLSILPLDSSYSLRCQHCEYEIHVDDEEDVAKAKELAERARLLRQRAITQAEFVRFLAENPLACTRLVATLNATRNCPHCGAELPGTFDRCWNCDTELEPGEGEAEEAPLAAGSDESTPSSFGGVQI